jgi:hypothetical protein
VFIADDIEDRSLIGKEGSKPGDHQALKIGRRDPPSLRPVLGGPDDERPRYVIAIARSLLDSMAWRQSFAALVKDKASEEAWLRCIRSHRTIHSVLRKHCLNLVPQRLVGNGRMLSRIGVAFVRDLAAIDAVLKHEIEGAVGEFLAAISRAVRQGPPLAPNSFGIKFCLQGAHRFELNISLEDMADCESLLFIDDQLPVLNVVTERRQATHPHALLLGSGDLVADSFAGHFPLELSK